MAFNFNCCQIDRTINYNGLEYRVIDQSNSGILIVAKEEDVKNKNYPLQLVAIPEEHDTKI